MASCRRASHISRRITKVGFSHAGKTATIELADTTLRVMDEHGGLITTAQRTGPVEISRFKAQGTRSRP